MSDEFQAGDVVWARVDKRGWWPGIIIDKEHLGKIPVRGRKSSLLVFWFGDGRVSPVLRVNVKEFRQGYAEFYKRQRGFESPMYQAITEYRKMTVGLSKLWNVQTAFSWADGGFAAPEDGTATARTGLSNYVKQKLEGAQPTEPASDSSEQEEEEDEEKAEGQAGSEEDEEEEEDELQELKISTAELTLRERLMNGEVEVNAICLCCFLPATHLQDHPLFLGKICLSCKDMFLERRFALGLDGSAFFCSMCLQQGQLLLCSQPGCTSAFCTKCIELKDKPGALETIWNSQTWDCYLCSDTSKYNPTRKTNHGCGLFVALRDWKRKVMKVFHPLELANLPSLRVLCLDGSVSTACAVLPRLRRFYLSISQVLLCGFPAQAVEKLQEALPCVSTRLVRTSLKRLALSSSAARAAGLLPVHLLIGRAAAEDFFSFCTVLQKLKALKPPVEIEVPLLFALEATQRSQPDYVLNSIATRHLECEPAKLDGKQVWTNIPVLWFDLEGPGMVAPHTQYRRGRGSKKKRKY